MRAIVRQRSGLVIVAAVCAGFVGCAAPVPYHVKTNVPWPDQWIAGPRAPYSRQLFVSAETVAWHRDTDPERMAAAAERKLSTLPSVFGFVRIDYARQQEDPTRPDKKALPFVEVRVVPVWFLAREGTTVGALDESTTFRDAVEGLARAMRRTVAWFDSEGLNDRCGPVPGGDPRSVLMHLLLERDLFVRCETGPPSVLRSLEFRDERAFATAIGVAAKHAAARYNDGPMEVVPLHEWIVDYVNRVCGGAEAAPVTIPRRSVGLLMPRDVTDDLVAAVKQQLLATLEYHVR